MKSESESSLPTGATHLQLAMACRHIYFPINGIMVFVREASVSSSLLIS
jgi:hypothetical protein